MPIDCSAMSSPPTSWTDCAAALGIQPTSAAERADRWRTSLRPRSALTRALRDPSVEPADLVDRTLDAAVGVATEAERLQRGCFGKSWTARQRAFQRQIAALELPRSAPAGFDPETWVAFKAVMESDSTDWEDADLDLPDEVARLRHLEAEVPAEYARLVEAALDVGARIDANTRRDAATMAWDLNQAQLFRTAWTRAFGGAARARPAAPLQLAVAVLHGALPLARYAAQCGHAADGSGQPPARRRYAPSTPRNSRPANSPRLAAEPATAPAQVSRLTDLNRTRRGASSPSTWRRYSTSARSPSGTA